MTEENTGLSPLNSAQSYFDNPIALPELPPSPVNPASKWNHFAAAALAPTKGGHFSESLSNALGAQAAQEDRDTELQARYIPILYDARMRRAQAQQQQQQQQQQLLQGWGTAMTGAMASLLDKPTITHGDVMSVAQAAVQQGKAPAKFAQDFVAPLMAQNPEALASYVRHMAIASSDPFRFVAAPKLEKVGVDDRLLSVGPDGKTVSTLAEGSMKPTDLARAQAELAAMKPGDPRIEAAKAYIQKLATHQPPLAQVIVNPEKTLVNAFSESEGKAFSEARQAAIASSNSMDTIYRLKDALASGKVLAGPGSKFPLVALQIGQAMAMTGKGNDEIITNTRQALQAASQLELDASAQMKGQGAITESERALLKKTAVDLDNMTTNELKQVADILEIRARKRVTSYNQAATRLHGLKNHINGEKIFKDTPLEMLTVSEPPTYGSHNVIRYDGNGNRIPNQ